MKVEGPKKKFLLPIIIVGVLILLYYGLILFLFFTNSLIFTSRGKTLEKYIQSKQSNYLPVLTTLFDKAQTTNVRSEFDNKYGSLLNDSSGKAMIAYFIRIKDGKLQKLFQSGDIKYENIDTPGEKKVAEMLKGNIEPVVYPQYTCCGGDDIWAETFPFTVLLPERRYLKDFPSELETILLIRDRNGIIQGAIVDLHGD